MTTHAEDSEKQADLAAHRAALTSALGADAFTALQAQPAVLEGLATLRATHKRLWDLEDLARSATASDQRMAEIKRAIDVENGARHGIIDASDALVSRPAPGAAARRSSETVCELSDRLIILGLKVDSTRALVEDATLAASERERCKQKLMRLSAWQVHLQGCLSQLLSELAQGLVELPPRQEFKLYNEKALNPVTRAE